MTGSSYHVIRQFREIHNQLDSISLVGHLFWHQAGIDVSESPRLFGLPIPLANQRRQRRFDGAAGTDSIVRQRIGGNL